MNQLEHLKALRDKARVQTEQAKAVLKQQGEITESLDRLIAALEGEDGLNAETQIDSISTAKNGVKAAVTPELAAVAAPAKKENGALGQLISNLEKKAPGEIALAGVAASGVTAVGAGKDEVEAKIEAVSPHNEVVWVEEQVPVIPETRKVSSERVPPRLEPIVWEVAEAKALPAAGNADHPESVETEAPVNLVAEDVGEADTEAAEAEADSGGISGPMAAAGGIAVAAGGALVGGLNQGQDEKSGSKFKFLKFGREADESAVEVTDESPGIVDPVEEKAESSSVPPPLPISGSVPVRGGSILSDAEIKAANFVDANTGTEDPEDVKIAETEAEGAADPSEDTVAINPSLAGIPVPGPVDVVLNEECLDELSEVVVLEEVVVVTEEVTVFEELVPDLEEEIVDPEIPTGLEDDDTVAISPPLPDEAAVEPENSIADDDTIPITPLPLPVMPPAPVLPAAPIMPATEPVMPTVSEVMPAAEPVLPPAPAIPAAAPVMPSAAEVELPARPVAEPERLPAVAVAVSSNIFFDANSAYLKDSELTKIQTISDAVSGAEPRIVKIQGLEDLASSNDFKILLASRRMLAVKKRLADKGIDINQLSINEIKLSPEGRVLEPPSILISPLGA